MNWGQLSAATLDAAFPRLAPFGAPALLSGGNLNFVWRVDGARGPAIAKRAPPWAASAPELALSPGRLLLEARALRAFEREPLVRVGAGAVRPPVLYGFCRQAWLLLEEDVGAGPDLGSALAQPALFEHLGAFIGALHRETFDATAFRRRFANRDVQRARLESQYAHVGAYAERSGAEDAHALGAVAVELGRRLLEPGSCLVMGDLWPPSVLPREGGLRLIDWEFATFGSPAQDVGHLLAHLAMHGLAGGSWPLVTRAADAFLDHYRVALGRRFHGLWTRAVHHDAAVHFGCELLARAWGPFRATGDGVTSLALNALRHPGAVPMLARLE